MHEGIKVNDYVISWDFESLPGRPNRFITGWVTEKRIEDGVFKIVVDFDSTGYNRKEVITPIKMAITEFSGRVKKLA